MLKKAFSLVQIMIAILIMGIAFSSIILTFISCYVLSEFNKSLTIALSHAQYIMEEKKNLASTSAGFNSLVNESLTKVDIEDKGLGSLNSENITLIVKNVTSDLKNITVEVFWKDFNRDRNITLNTKIAKP